MSDTLIKCENISKKFCRDLKRSLFYGIMDLGKELTGTGVSSKNHLRTKEFWALKDVSFEVKRGECLGLIGRNGAGKSTLLKMLNGLIKPDQGRIELRGRVGALIELGAGFNPILTGRENIYVNGAVLGLKKSEINKLFDKIVAFSELEDFIDTPVQYYSSGMKVRLGFAVAAQMKPDVLLVDEVLAVGDAGFKIKCYNEINKIVRNTAVIFVSHSMSQVGKICSRGIVLKDGGIHSQNENIAEAIDAYNNLFEFGSLDISGEGKAGILSLGLSNQGKDDAIKRSISIEELTTGNVCVNVEYGKPLFVRLTLQVDPAIEFFNVSYSFGDMEQKLVGQCFSKANSEPFINTGEPVVINTFIESLNLNQGKYSFDVVVRDSMPGNSGGEKYLAVYKQLLELQITNNSYWGSAPVQFQADWRIEHSDNL